MMNAHLARLLVVLGVVGCGDNDRAAVGPETVIDRAPAALSSRTHVEVAFHAVGAAASFTCSLDGATPAECASPWTFEVTDGMHQIAIASIDPGGVAGKPATASFTVDTVAPDTVITVGPSAVVMAATASFTFAASPAEAGATYECALDGAAFTACTSPMTTAALTDGDHAFRVRAIDAAGNVDPTPAMYAWAIDTMGPPIALVQTPADPSNVATPTFRFSTTEASTTFECQIDGVTTFAPCTSPYTAPMLPDGMHTFRVRATDAAQNQTMASYAWTVDTIAPAVAITGGPAGPTSTATPAFAFTVSADATVVECAVDAAVFAPCTSPTTTSTLGEGMHGFTVRASDAAGNLATASRTFAVDTVQPTVTIVSGPNGPTNHATPTWTFTTTDAPTVIECAIDSGAPAPCTGSFTPAASLGDGAHTFTVRVADAAGNQGTDARAIDVDTAPPVITITGGPTATTLDTTPTFTFTIAGTFVASRCRIDAAAFTPCAGTFTSSPLGGGPHVFEVQADDAAGNTGSA
ncbi:MAG TPA: Ig-like domain-containing protein, partial [Kofleriaceae bacterium]|nr:Ig-like domain-containing protein [Kofleriaceae bacterium]